MLCDFPAGHAAMQYEAHDDGHSGRFCRAIHHGRVREYDPARRERVSAALCSAVESKAMI
jgi:hypothetical protein